MQQYQISSRNSKVLLRITHLCGSQIAEYVRELTVATNRREREIDQLPATLWHIDIISHQNIPKIETSSGAESNPEDNVAYSGYI